MSDGGIEIFICKVDALIDDASSVIRVVKAQFAAVGDNVENKKEQILFVKCLLVSSNRSSTATCLTT